MAFTHKQLASKNYIFTALMSVFEIVKNNFALENVLDYVRSPLCRLDEQEKHLLENYVIEAGNTPSMWDLSKPVNFQGDFSDFQFVLTCRIEKSVL